MSFKTNRKTGGIFRTGGKKIRKEYTILIDLHGKPGEEYDPETDDQYEREYIMADSQKSAERIARKMYPWANGDLQVVEGHNVATGDENY